jgi:hypothetical protein
MRSERVEFSGQLLQLAKAGRILKPLTVLRFGPDFFSIRTYSGSAAQVADLYLRCRYERVIIIFSKLSAFKRVAPFISHHPRMRVAVRGAEAPEARVNQAWAPSAEASAKANAQKGTDQNHVVEVYKDAHLRGRRPNQRELHRKHSRCRECEQPGVRSAPLSPRASFKRSDPFIESSERRRSLVDKDDNAVRHHEPTVMKLSIRAGVPPLGECQQHDLVITHGGFT